MIKHAGLIMDRIAKLGPVVGISVGDPDDKSTWRIDYEGSPTDQQIAAVNAAIAAFEWTGERVKSVSPRQIRIALLQAGLLTQVETAIENADTAAQISWEFSTEVLRDQPMVTQLGKALGLSEAQIDALFSTASRL